MAKNNIKIMVEQFGDLLYVATDVSGLTLRIQIPKNISADKVIKLAQNAK